MKKPRTGGAGLLGFHHGGEPVMARATLIGARRNRSAYTRSTCGLTAEAVCLVVIQSGDTTLHI